MKRWLILMLFATLGAAADFVHTPVGDWLAAYILMVDGTIPLLGLKDGEFYRLSFDICGSDNTLERISFTYTAAPGQLQFQYHELDSDKTCKASFDQFGNPLPYRGSKGAVTGTGSPPPLSPQVEGSAARRASAASSGPFKLQMPFRAIPFAPLYPTSAFPSPPPCDPNNNATAVVVNHALGSVTRLTGCTDDILAVIPVVSNPLQVDFTPDGSLALVTSYDSAISFIDMTTNKVVKTLVTAPDVHPSGIAISPDGSRAYVSNFFPINPSVLVIDIASRSILNTIPLGVQYPQSAVLSPDGSTLWVTHALNNAVTLIDTLSATVVGQLTIQRPFDVAFNATGTQAFVTSGTNPGAVLILDTTTYSVIKVIPVDNGPVEVKVLPDDALVVVSNYFGQSISVIDPKTFAVQTFPVAGHPMGLAVVQ
jgi:DNA-binding beta-propeller fold protein YncE